MSNVFATLSAINVNDYVEQKNGLTYLSWAFAWEQVKKNFPDAIYTVYENADGLNYHHDCRTAWVKTGVTINGLEHIEYLPVMNHRNQAISVDSITSTDVNKTIQRSLTKACARHGLGLYIYAKEDLPTAEKEAVEQEWEQQMLERIDACENVDQVKAMWAEIKQRKPNINYNAPVMVALKNKKDSLS